MKIQVFKNKIQKHTQIQIVYKHKHGQGVIDFWRKNVAHAVK